VLALERSDVPGAWQLPQGGLEPGEEPLDAVMREIEEETGIEPRLLDPVTQEYRLLTYELPEAYRSGKTGRGQTQYWFLFKYSGTDEDIRPDRSREFSQWKWTSMEKLVSEVVEFRKPVYEELANFLENHRK